MSYVRFNFKTLSEIHDNSIVEYRLIIVLELYKLMFRALFISLHIFKITFCIMNLHKISSYEEQLAAA